MAYLTLASARAAAASPTVELAQKSLRASAAAAPMTQSFDVFLSHCVRDARAIEGVRTLLMRSGLSVYVDWIDDPLLSRNSVTPLTAATLRARMRRSSSLIFATSEASPSSRWMPWELGYFDGYKPEHVAILPLIESGQGFGGQEYLGLYPKLEDVGAGLGRLGMPLRGGGTMSAAEFVRGGAHIVV
ncbi:MAG: hypothetical protein JWQ07_5904 [Ramlibacter sp.]|nr:hypothetical protein [Ramlibacter sp.]